MHNKNLGLSSWKSCPTSTGCSEFRASLPWYELVASGIGVRNKPNSTARFNLKLVRLGRCRKNPKSITAVVFKACLHDSTMCPVLASKSQPFHTGQQHGPPL